MDGIGLSRASARTCFASCQPMQKRFILYPMDMGLPQILFPRTIYQVRQHQVAAPIWTPAAIQTQARIKYNFRGDANLSQTEILQALMCIHHILVVDDEPVLADACKQYLEHFGYQVTVAYDGQTALALQESQPVDALITDFRMPKMNGLELLTRMRQARPTMPAIMVSGFPGDFRQPEDPRTKVFSKPTRLRTLAECIKDMPCEARM